jgi:hypothetical protein
MCDEMRKKTKFFSYFRAFQERKMKTTHETHFQQKAHQSNAMNHRLSILKDSYSFLIRSVISKIIYFFFLGQEHKFSDVLRKC